MCACDRIHIPADAIQNSEGKRPPFAESAKELYMSASEVHAAMRRGPDVTRPRSGRTSNYKALEEFLIHGLKYVYPVSPATAQSILSTH